LIHARSLKLHTSNFKQGSEELRKIAVAVTIQKMKKSTVGLAPGTLLYEGEEKTTEIRLLSYTHEGKAEQIVENISELPKLLQSKMVHWVQVRGVGDLEKMKLLGEALDISNLVLEDVLNKYHRPKVEFFDDYDFVTLRRYFSHKEVIDSDQISLIIMSHVIVSFQHTQENIFSVLEDRFAKRKPGRLSFHGTLYLAYAILDIIIDQYFLVQEYFEEKIETLSVEVHKQTPQNDIRDRLYLLRTGLLSFRKAVFPLVEMTDRLLKTPRYIEGKNNITIYIQDLRDHILHMQDFVRTYGEMLEGLSSFFFSITADKTNQIMQMLTVITIIFLPLTLLSGIYGMNFQYMPELTQKWAYPVLLGTMLLIASSIYFFFKRKKWL
jgi:magnesium transporter